MRILVVSDSHGRPSMVERALLAQPSAKHLIFLGDGLAEIQTLMSHRLQPAFHFVRGNCDFGCGAPENGVLRVPGALFYFTHGHRQQVKYSEKRLLTEARRCGADVVLYGHTHVPLAKYADGVHLVNPGAAEAGCYAVVDITAAGVVPILMKV